MEAESEEVIVSMLEKVVGESIWEEEVVSAVVIVVSGGEESLPVSLGFPISMSKTYLMMSRHECQA